MFKDIKVTGIKISIDETTKETIVEKTIILFDNQGRFEDYICHEFYELAE